MTLPNYLALTILIYLLIKSTLIAISYKNTGANLGTAFEGGTIYEADF